MYLIKSSGKTGGQKNSKEADNMILKKNSLMNLQTSLIDLKISCKRASTYTDTDKPNIINMVN